MPTESTAMLANRLRRRQRQLRRWADRQGIEAYRLYERDIPDHPLIVDWYAGAIVAWCYPRKRDETATAAQAWHAAVRTAICDGLSRHEDQVILKIRQRQRGDAQYQRLAEEGRLHQIAEGPLRFEVNLSDYLDTGLFLDHRDTRRRVMAEAAGQAVLNLFAYTGSFTCAAAKGGARHSDTVDLSRTYLDWAARNLQLNGSEVGDRHRLHHADCLQFLAAEPTRRYDLIVCDPPTFSNSKRMQQTWSVARDHPWLFWRLWNYCRSGGSVYFSTNDRGFELANQGLPPFTYDELTPASLPEDFRNRRVHRCWLLHRR